MSAEDANAWLVVLTAINVIGLVLGGWVLWSLRRAFVGRSEFDAAMDQIPRDLGERLDRVRDRGAEQDQRLAVLEHQMERTPSRDEIHNLEIAVTRVETTISGLDHRLNGLQTLLERFERQVNVMDGYLREVDRAK
jgi:uncharacterized coiled-coil protein SlyX